MALVLKKKQYLPYITILGLAFSTTEHLHAHLPFTGPAEIAAPEAIPLPERALRLVDTLLLEPGYLRARRLAREWHAYVTQFLQSEELAQQLEGLANEQAILYFLRDTERALAPVFAKEAERVLNRFGNGALIAWRLRSLSGKSVLAHNADRLKDFTPGEIRREIGPRFISVPISGAGYNFSLDAEWDFTRLNEYPLNETGSEFLFIQTDAELSLKGRSELRHLPDSAYRFISGDKFIATPHLVQNSMRIIAVHADELRLFICYPFAGYLFYAGRGIIALLLFTSGILIIHLLRSLKKIAKDAIENRSAHWLPEHYEKSLNLNEQALKVADRSVALVSEIKERDQTLISTLSQKLGEIATGIEEQTRVLIEEAFSAKTPSPLPSTPPEPPKQPIHRKVVAKPPILIDASEPGEIQVSIELDLPLAEEKQLPPEARVQYIHSLRRKAAEKAGNREFIHDEAMDNFDYTPEAPLPLPTKPAFTLKKAPDAGELEYVQKFRYTSKNRVIPLTVQPAATGSLKMREDLQRHELVVSGEEE